MASPYFDNFLEELEARTEIQDCLNVSARAIDRKDWELAKTVYHEGAIDEHGFFSGAPERLLEIIAEKHVHQDHSMHVNSNTLIEFRAKDKAFVETYVLVFQRYTDQEPGVPPGSYGKRVLASARYLDRFEKRNGRWAIAHRTLAFGDVVTEPMSAPAGFPPSYIEQKHGMDDILYTVDRG